MASEPTLCPITSARSAGSWRGFQRRRLWRLLKEISERLASWFPQTRMSQGFWWCLVAVSEGNRGNHLRVINGAGQACFESPQSMKRNFRPFKNRTAVTKEERIRQRRNCAAINLLKSQAPIKKSYRQKKSIAKQRRQNGSLGRLK